MTGVGIANMVGYPQTAGNFYLYTRITSSENEGKPPP